DKADEGQHQADADKIPVGGGEETRREHPSAERMKRQEFVRPPQIKDRTVAGAQAFAIVAPALLEGRRDEEPIDRREFGFEGRWAVASGDSRAQAADA